MGRIIKESIFEMRKNRGLTFLMIFQISLSIIFLNLFIAVFQEDIKKTDAEVKENDGIQTLQLRDSLVDESERAFMANEDALVRLKRMYSMLKSKREYGYAEAYNNPVLMFSDKVPQTALYMYDYGDAERSVGIIDGKTACEVKCLIVDSEFIKHNRLESIKGEEIPSELFEDNGNGNPIIIVGNEYEGVFNSGDFIHVVTPFDKGNDMEVHAVLKEGSNVLYRNQYLNLNKYVVIAMPEGKSIPTDDEDYHNQIILFLFKINGVFYTRANPNEVQSYVNEVCDALGVIPASNVSNSTNAQVTITGTSIKTLIDAFKQLLMLICIFSILSTVLFAFIKAKRNKKYYAVLLINGYTKGELFLIMAGSMLLILSVSNVVGLTVGKIVGKMLGSPNAISIDTTVLADAIILNVAVITAMIIVKKTEIWRLFKEIND